MDRIVPVQRFVTRALGLIRPAGGALVLAMVAGACSTVAAQQGEGDDPFAIRSTNDGVYTEEQADEGLEIFTNICSNCHNAQNPLSGEGFLRRWTGQPLYVMWNYMLYNMPYGNPASLTPAQYSAMVAYVLRENGLPAGDRAVPELAHEIANIDFDPPKKP